MQKQSAVHAPVINSKQRTFMRQLNKHKLHLCMIIPVIVWFIIFKYIPLYGVTLAFKDFKIKAGIMGSPWAGLKHFENLFMGDQGRFMDAFKNTLILAVFNFVFGFPAPIVLALFLNELRADKFKRVVQTVSYLPHFISWIVLSGIFMEILSPSRGPVNALIQALGGEPIYFMGDPKYFRLTLVVTNIWKSVGWGSIVYLAALTGVSEELYDAARVDGCGRWKRIWHVTIPAIVPTITIMLIMNAGNLIGDNFDQVFNMRNPGVLSVSNVLGTYIYDKGIESGQYSMSTAADLFRNVIALMLTLATNAISKRVNDYGLW